MKICIDNAKCENFLEVGKQYQTKQSELREEYYSVFISDTKKRIKDGWFDFKKTRFSASI